MIKAIYTPLNIEVEITGQADRDRYFIATLDDSRPFTRQTMGGPEQTGWKVVSRDHLRVEIATRRSRRPGFIKPEPIQIDRVFAPIFGGRKERPHFKVFDLNSD